MSEHTKLFERAAARYEPPDLPMDGLLNRRDRKRRNQRIAAGVVGIVVFVATVWIVTGVAPLNRSEKSVTPAGDVSGPAETGPAETGPIESVGPGSVWLPPKGAQPSTPTAGKLVAEGGGIHPWHAVQVYADGRVIWFRQAGFTGNTTTAPTTGWLERHLTPAGVEMVRSGAIAVEDVDPPTDVPASVWEDPGPTIYVPSRYVVCAEWSNETLRLLPERTRNLLRGSIDEQAVVRGEVDYGAGGRGVSCPIVTIDEARTLDRIFLEAGFDRSETAGGLMYDILDASSIGLVPLLPDGTFKQCCPG
jgi:hypothetical protein